jgi:hypothetical protein
VRTRVWNNLTNIKFQHYYFQDLASLVSDVDKWLSIFLALVSSVSVGSWLIWKEHPEIWATIIGVSQLIIIIKPFFPILEQESEFVKYSLDLNKLSLIYEKLWRKCDKNGFDNCEEAFSQLKGEEHNLIDKYSALRIPEYQFLIRKARKRIDSYIEINFPP